MSIRRHDYDEEHCGDNRRGAPFGAGHAQDFANANRSALSLSA
jgi:hypothetical protein